MRFRFHGFLLGCLVGTGCGFAQIPPPNVGATDGNSATATETVNDLLSAAGGHLENGELAEALRLADSALEIDPHNPEVYEFRGSVYVKQKLWDRAEQDYREALNIAPSVSAYKYQLAEIKFLQKDFNAARPRFAVLLNDETLGDLAAYKIFICDLFSDHRERASAELAAFNNKKEYPSYYFAHALWDFLHNRNKDASALLNASISNFGSEKCENYLASLNELSNVQFPVVSFVSKEGNAYDRAKVILEDDGLRVSSSNGWITVPIEQLPDDLSPFPDEMRRQIAEKRDHLVTPSPLRNLVSFTTKSGKHYDGVNVLVKDEGLCFLTPDGWVTIPFSDLPKNLSGFPDELHRQIAEKRDHLVAPSPLRNLVSFTTKSGKHYDGVNVLVKDEGLCFLTPDGWITVPFSDLPKNLSGFPDELHRQIAEKRDHLVAPSPLRNLVSFTTKSGKHYDGVNVLVKDEGLCFLTPDGWITVPFSDLPKNLSGFPDELRKQIIAARQEPLPATNARSATFTTKDGKTYQQDRISIQNNGLEVFTSDGWITVPFDLLPNNLSVFPADVQKEIITKRERASKTSDGPIWLSFTTKNGQKYDEVEVSIGQSGLRSLTDDGWILVPFDQLPDDLSPFPVQWRERISAQKKALLKKGGDASSATAKQADKSAQKADH